MHIIIPSLDNLDTLQSNKLNKLLHGHNNEVRKTLPKKLLIRNY